MVLKVTKTNIRKKPSIPQIKITNDTYIDRYVNGIELTFDSYFTLFGTVEIIVGGEKILYDNNAADFRQYRVFPVPIDSKRLKPLESIEAYVWNPLTDDVILLSVNAQIDDVQKISTLSGQAIDNEAILSEISGGAGNSQDTHDIFPYSIYRSETKEFLVNTRGRNNMLLTMASSNVIAPFIIPHSFVPDAIPPDIDVKINHIPDVTPDTQSATVQTHFARAGPIRDRNWSVQTERKSYTITKHLNSLVDVTLDDGSPLGSVLFASFADKYSLIDGVGTDLKQVEFAFNASDYELDGIQSVGFDSHYVETWESAQLVQFRSAGFPSVIKVVISPWSAFSKINTVNHYVSADVMLRCVFSYEAQSSDDINFATFTSLGNITNGQQSLSFSDRYLRIKRTVTGISLTSSANTENHPETNSLSYHIIPENHTIVSLIDKLTDGGTASLHFELNGVNNEWFTVLDSSQLGAVTQGQKKLIQYSIEGIPPSQSRFKAVLEVNGSLKTGVTIDLVA